MSFAWATKLADAADLAVPAETKEELTSVLTCSLSRGLFIKPVFAPDGHVYEQNWICRWLRQNPTSPMTHENMRPSQVFRERVVEQASEALWQWCGEARPVEEEAVLLDACGPDEEPPLFKAIVARDEGGALELLQGGGVAGLNDVFSDEGATLLHHALLNKLPAVAGAIVVHPAFEKHLAKMGRREGITAVHIAIALGFTSVCQALLQVCGVRLLADKVIRTAVLDLPGVGEPEELHLFRGDDVLGIAERHNHAEIYKVFRDAVSHYLSMHRRSQQTEDHSNSVSAYYRRDRTDF